MKHCIVCGRVLDSTPTRGRPSMVCSDACRYTRKNAQREESRQRAAKRGCPPHMHGTCAGYTQYKCDCDACKLWARTYKADWRSKRKEATVKAHG